MRRIRLSAVLLLAASAAAFAVQRQTWKQTSSEDFGKGKFDRTVATSDGVVMLSRKVDPLLAPGEGTLFVTALAEDTKGTIYAATGPKGVIYRKAKADKEFAPWYSGPDKMINCLFIDAADRLYAGTSGEKGRLLRIVDKDHADELFTDPDCQHVWAVASDARGNFFLATGAKGKLFKLTDKGRKEVLFTADNDRNFTALAVTPEGVVYGGTDANGLIFRVSTTGEVFCLYDAPQAEISVLALDAKGNLLAATASVKPEGEGGGGGGSSGSMSDDEVRDIVRLAEGGGRPADLGSESFSDVAGGDDNDAEADGPASPGSRPAAGAGAERMNGPSSTRPGGPGGPGGGPGGPSGPGGRAGAEGNSLYRITEEGVVTELFSTPAGILSLAQEADRILVGTDDGTVVEISSDGRRTAPIIQLEDAKQVTDILKTAGGGLLLATAEKGGVFTASAGYAERGTFLSEVHDAKLVSRFGRLQWSARVPANATVSIATRTGNVEEPGATWSKWSDELRDPEASRVLSPPARFIQYRVTFSSMNAAASGVLDEVQVTCVAENQPPKITELGTDGKDAKGGPKGGPPQPQRPSEEGKATTFRWAADDPNGDSLVFDLAFRGVGEPVWIPLEKNLDKNEYAWKTDQVADGRYEFKVVAKDTPDNTPDAAASAERVSDPILVDNTAPIIKDILYKWQADGSLRVEATVADATSVVTAARFAVDSKDEWLPAAALDDIFDFPTEKIYFTIKNPARGPHRVAIRAVDEAGNIANAAITILPPGD